ncbi:MAG: hypothetical protein V4805_16295 [Pseudomonadota bacterium]
MFLDHPTLTATNSLSEPDRIERLMRVYGYVVALADIAGDPEFILKVSQLHDHKGTLIVFWSDPPTEEEKYLFVKAWESKMGDGSSSVEHEL